MADDLHLRKLRIVVVMPNGERLQPWSIVSLSIMDGVATVIQRRKDRRTGEVASVESTGIKDEYAITMTDGEVWETRGCGCG